MIVDANPSAEALLEQPRSALVGHHIVDLHPPDQREIARAAFAAHAAGDRLPLELDVLRPSGERVPVEIRAARYDLGGGVAMVLGTFRDLTALRLIESKEARATRALAAIHSAGLAAHASDGEAALIDAICRGLAIGGTTVFVAMANDDPGCSLTIRSAAGPGAAIADSLRLSWADDPHGIGPAGRAVRFGTTQIEDDAFAAAGVEQWKPLLTRFRVKSLIAVPLHERERVIGALEIFSPHPSAFGAFEKALFEDIASQLVFGMRLRREIAERQATAEDLRLRDEDIRVALEQTVAAIGTTLEMRDPYTAGHGRAVATLSEKIGRAMGFPADRCHGLFLAGTMHDVGKIRIPAEILSKPGALSPVEYELLKSHAEAGYEILRGITFPWPIAEITRQHHERLDGSGYPRGLSGGEILIEAQIVACADIVDSMCSHRPYRPALGLERALETLRTFSGLQLDAGVIGAALSVLEALDPGL